MNRTKLGKVIITFVLIVGAVVSVAVDWNNTHLFNPDWHPHAKFHDALHIKEILAPAGEDVANAAHRSSLDQIQ